MARTGISQALLFTEMARLGLSTRGELVRHTGMTKASISRIIDQLLESGWVSEGHKIQNDRPGRPTSQLIARPDLAYVVGTDLEGSAIRACVLDCARQPVVCGRRNIDTTWSSERILAEWAELIRETVGNSKVDPEDIAGMGLGLPGLYHRKKQNVHAYLPPGRWVDFAVQPLFDSLDMEFTGANNMLCVSEYERRSGAGIGQKTFLSVLVRYGIGAALFAREQFLAGEDVFCGELGHMRIRADGPECICGQTGCLDSFASGRIWPAGDERTGDEWWDFLGGSSRALAVGIANIIKIFPSPTVILNGIYNDYQ
ncbi:MAG: ROK family transcriptional regulator, partial [Verrucomicrobiota bacterium]